jgi:hypothetical protein
MPGKQEPDRSLVSTTWSDLRRLIARIDIRRLFRDVFARQENGFVGTAPAKHLHGIAISTVIASRVSAAASKGSGFVRQRTLADRRMASGFSRKSSTYSVTHPDRPRWPQPGARVLAAIVHVRGWQSPTLRATTISFVEAWGKCYPCLRYGLLPLCPERTRDGWRARRDHNFARNLL